MNSLVKDLSERANEWAKCANWSTNPEYGDKRFEDLYNEKFAELIVQECCKWLEGTPTTEEGTMILPKNFIITNVKSYFGVKE